MIQKKNNYNNGMTLIELIVVLGIFAVLSLVVIFNYGNFQSKVDITNLANDIALQVVQSQRSALNGLLPAKVPTNPGYPSTPWEPAYGVYFSSTAGADADGANSQNFIYFVDLNNNTVFDGTNCQGECLSTYSITKGDYISHLDAYYTNGASTLGVKNATITFTRPNSGATINVSPSFGTVSYLEITVLDSTGKTSSHIYLYNSGRIQID